MKRAENDEMKIVNSLGELKLPLRQQMFLEHFLSNIVKIVSVEEVILFGSCARGNCHADSDIDVLIMGDNIGKEDELSIMFDCPPHYGHHAYLDADIVVGSRLIYEKYKNSHGMIQRQIEKEGVDLSGLIQQRRKVGA
jgi:hypothetical protein